MMEKKVVVRVPRAVPRRTARRRVILGALKVHVEQKHEDVAHLWGTRLQTQKVRESWRRKYLGKCLPRGHLFKEKRGAPFKVPE
jgi:hypothetical protein